MEINVEFEKEIFIVERIKKKMYKFGRRVRILG